VLQLFTNAGLFWVLLTTFLEHAGLKFFQELQCTEVEYLLRRVLQMNVHAMHNPIEKWLVNQVLIAEPFDQLSEIRVR